MKFPDDPNSKPEAGWGPFKMKYLYMLLRRKDPYQPFVEWHDSVTTKGSKAQEAGISADRVQEAGEDQLRVLEKDLPKEWKNMRWLAHKIRRIYHQVTEKTRYWFYEGPKK